MLRELADSVLECVADSLSTDFHDDDGIFEREAVDDILQLHATGRVDLISGERTAVDECAVSILRKPHQIREEVPIVGLLHLTFLLPRFQRYGCGANLILEFALDLCHSFFLQLLQ